MLVVRHRPISGFGDLPGDPQTILGKTEGAAVLTAAQRLRAARNLQLTPGVTSGRRQALVDALAARSATREAVAALAPECPCLVDALEIYASEQGVTLDESQRTDALAQCATDPVAFQRTMVEQLGIQLGWRQMDPCKPWYARRATWGAAAVLGVLGVAAWAAVGRS